MDILWFDSKLTKIADEHIGDSLLYITNNSLLNGIFPDEWKLARVTPVFRNNWDVNVMSNYRPISVIGHIAKWWSNWCDPSSMHIWPFFYHTWPSCITKRPFHADNFISRHRWLVDNINEDQITGVCLLDISKCFDTINHSILLKKISIYGIK